MKIFSSVCATFDSDFTIWLPPREELQNFIEHLSGFEIRASENDGQLCIVGTLEAMVSIKDSLSNFILVNEEEDGRTEINLETPGVSDEPNNYSNSSIQQLEELSFENEISSDFNDVEGSENCLNIEVLHSKSKQEAKKKEFKFSCSLCSFKSQRESHYQKHMNLHETNSTIFHCDKCNFSTLRFTHLRHHQITHSAKPTMCPTVACSYSTDNAKLFIKHQRLKHKVVSSRTDQVIRNCPACSYKTTSLYLYERHMKIHSAEENKGGPNLFICNQCDYRTTRKMHYVRHVRDVHREWRPYLCDLCGKAFKRPDALKQHNILHSTPEKDGSFPFQCLVKSCLKKCHSKAHLNVFNAILQNTKRSTLLNDHSFVRSAGRHSKRARFNVSTLQTYTKTPALFFVIFAISALTQTTRCGDT
ncbi:RE1-silencing transcription factor B-like isoform X2 [Daphnia pulex]|uniref:RE1-silencing transcription factor B-like isoform X2 n=1 Tax=Daphnia pulex TaxID=6669 RepID=UPI001EDF7CCA|nr:RE1-silencing transcription factor B-like isoform X2 [Daphnia pulex]